MITEIILVIFAIIYYLFSAFFIATILQDTSNYSIWHIIKCVIITILTSPIITPVILGIEIGECINNN